MSAEDAEVRWRVLTKLENEQGLTLQKLAEDCQSVTQKRSRNQVGLRLEKSEVNRRQPPIPLKKTKGKSHVLNPAINKTQIGEKKTKNARTMLPFW